MSPGDSRVRKAQAPLRERYTEEPEAAFISDTARTTGTVLPDPFHGTVIPGRGHEKEWSYGVHRAVGGPHDAPVPGDILCSALATCLESTIRMIADRLSVELQSLEVSVSADVDVRGTLAVDRDVPVGFQSMRCEVEMEPAGDVDAELLQKVFRSAERSCVVLQTLRSGVDVDATLSTE